MGRVRSGPADMDRTAMAVTIAAIGIALQVVFLASLLFVWRVGLNDFSVEAAPAYHALFAGHLLQFYREAPQYVGSLVVRAPFALVANALGGTMRSVYFWTALPCLITAPVLGAWLASRAEPARSGGRSIARVSPLVLSAVNPIVILGILGGHPEEVLGAVLCVTAVVLASDGRSALAGVAVGVAVANKPWALAAVPVVLAVLPTRRWRSIAWMLMPIAVVLGPALLVRVTTVGTAGTVGSLGSSAAGLLLPATLLWWFGKGSWVVVNAHIIIIIVACIASGAWWFTRREGSSVKRDRGQALLLLALVMLLRAALDPWDNVYYHLPFLFAVMAYEAGRPAYATAVLTTFTLGLGASFLHFPADTRALLYALFALLTTMWLMLRTYQRPAAEPSSVRPRRAAGAVGGLRGAISRPMNG